MTQMLRNLFMSTLIAGLLTGCVYKADIQQGNVITQDNLQNIHTGMSTAQVQKLLGKPLLNNVYRDNRLVYVYTMKRGHKKMTAISATISFINSRVTAVKVRYTPPQSHPATH